MNGTYASTPHSGTRSGSPGWKCCRPKYGTAMQAATPAVKSNLSPSNEPVLAASDFELMLGGDRLQVGEESSGRRIAVLLVLRQEPQHDSLEGRGNASLALARFDDGALPDGGDRVLRRV